MDAPPSAIVNFCQIMAAMQEAVPGSRVIFEMAAGGQQVILHVRAMANGRQFEQSFSYELRMNDTQALGYAERIAATVHVEYQRIKATTAGKV